MKRVNFKADKLHISEAVSNTESKAQTRPAQSESWCKIQKSTNAPVGPSMQFAGSVQNESVGPPVQKKSFRIIQNFETEATQY